MGISPVLICKTRSFPSRVWSQVQCKANNFYCFSDHDKGRPHLQENQQESLETLHKLIILLCRMSSIKVKFVWKHLHNKPLCCCYKKVQASKTHKNPGKKTGQQAEPSHRETLCVTACQPHSEIQALLSFLGRTAGLCTAGWMEKYCAKTRERVLSPSLKTWPKWHQSDWQGQRTRWLRVADVGEPAWKAALGQRPALGELRHPSSHSYAHLFKRGARPTGSGHPITFSPPSFPTSKGHQTAFRCSVLPQTVPDKLGYWI